jgi:hypothetical protein
MRIPAEGTRVAFMKNSTVYVSRGYILTRCSPLCDSDHDCLKEDHLVVDEIIGTALPLNTLTFVFDENHKGIAINEEGSNARVPTP